MMQRVQSHMMKKSHNKNRVFKNQPGYVQNRNGRWVRKDKNLPTSIDPFTVNSVQEDFSSYSAIQQEIQSYNIAIEDISHKTEKELRSTLISPEERDTMEWDDFVKVLESHDIDESKYEPLDEKLIEFMSQHSIFDNQCAFTELTLWRINTVCRTNSNEELVEFIQDNVDFYLDNTSINYKIKGDISNDWSKEWKDYQGNIPAIDFEDISTEEDVEKLNNVYSMLGGKRLYIASGDDNKPSNDEHNTNLRARITPSNERDKNHLLYYLVSKEGENGEEYYIYNKDRTLPAPIYSYRSTPGKPSSYVDKAREEKRNEKIKSAGSQHRLSQTMFDDSVEGIFTHVASTGYCGIPWEEKKKNMLITQQYDSLAKDNGSSFSDINQQQYKQLESVHYWFDTCEEEDLDNINILRNHSAESERKYQKREASTDIIALASQIGEYDIAKVEKLPNGGSFANFFSQTWKNAGKEIKDSAKKFQTKPLKTTFDAAKSIKDIFL